jgi:hypothetical protein
MHTVSSTMNVALLIDSVVRQTMILIAQLSTTSGVRAPLAHVANQVFLDLVTELERQGVGRKVIADMFGLALRSYQQKVQRLAESATDRGASLWEAVFRFVQEKQAVSRARVLSRFARDDSASVRGILNDLVGSGLVYKTGRGDATVYRAAPSEDLEHAMADANDEAETSLLWLSVYRDGPIDRATLLERLRLAPQALDRALDRLVEEGRVRRRDGDPPLYSADTCLIPLSEIAGWEAAFIDHYQAMVGAMCAKLAGFGAPGEPARGIGGSTFSFDVWPEHPYAERVAGLLERTRGELGALWNEVRSHNASAPRPDQYQRITFYFGQNVRVETREEPA